MINFDRMSEWIWNKRISIGVFFILIAICTIPFAIRVTPDNSVDAISVKGDPKIDLANRTDKLFGSEEYITVTYENADIFSKESLAISDQVSRFMLSQSEYSEVLSITNISKVENHKENGEDSLEVVPFLNPEWIQTAVPEDKKQELLKTPLYQNLIYNESGTAAAIFGRLIPLGADEQKRSEIINKLRNVTNQISKQTGINLHVYGWPVMNRSVLEVVEREQNTLNPLMIVAMAILVVVIYQNAFITLITMLQFLATLGIVMGVLGIFNVHLNWLTAFAPAVMMIMSMCDAVYVINEFQEADYTLPASERLKIMFRNIGIPCLFTSIVNGFAFASLVTSPVRPLQEYGLYIFIAVIIEYAISFTIFPILLNTIRSKRSKPKREANPYLKAIINSAYDTVVKSPMRTGVFCLLIVIISCIGMWQLEVNQWSLKYFKRDPYGLVQANEFSKKGVGGGIEVGVMIDTDRPGILLEPENLRMMEEMQSRSLSEGTTIKKTLSLVDFVKYFNQVLHDNDPSYYKIPDTKQEVSQLVLLMEMSGDKLNLRSFTNTDYSKGLIRIFSRVTDTVKEAMTYFAHAEHLITEIFHPSLNAKLTGKIIITNSVIRFVPSTIVVSVLTSIVFIGLAMMLLFRSVYVGFLSILPSILPILMIAGLMGFLGIWINIASAMTFAVSLGIAMDDTINIIWRMQKYVTDLGLTHEAALKKIYDEIGVPLVGSSLLLAAGYMMLVFSQIWPTTHFGMSVALCCLFALIGDLLLIPLIFLKLKPFKPKVLIP